MGHPVYQLIHPANIMYIEILIILCYVIRRMEPDFCVEKNQHKSPSFHFPPGITFRGVSNDHSANSVQVRYRIYISISMIIYLN